MINGEKESEGVFSLSLSLIIVHSTKPSRVLSPFLFATFSFQPPSPLPPLSTTSFCISSSTPPPSSSRRIILGLDIIIHPRKTQCDIFLLVNYLCVAFLKLLPPFRRFPFDDYPPSPSLLISSLVDLVSNEFQVPLLRNNTNCLLDLWKQCERRYRIGVVPYKFARAII